jgi:hypothetical protein
MDTQQHGDDLITASEVAEIWNARAKEMGYARRYTRRSVNVRRMRGKQLLVPAQETSLGNLYRRSDAWKYPIRPERGRKVQAKQEAVP